MSSKFSIKKISGYPDYKYNEESGLVFKDKKIYGRFENGCIINFDKQTAKICDKFGIKYDPSLLENEKKEEEDNDNSNEDGEESEEDNDNSNEDDDNDNSNEDDNSNEEDNSNEDEEDDEENNDNSNEEDNINENKVDIITISCQKDTVDNTDNLFSNIENMLGTELSKIKSVMKSYANTIKELNMKNDTLTNEYNLLKSNYEQLNLKFENIKKLF